ncbi:MAG: hypothetical protein AAFZ07_29685, partial [Actinomycetota bacterium]
DTLKLADQFASHLENAARIDVLPVNRVIAAMEIADIDVVRTKFEAQTLLAELDVDGIVVGTIAAYEPYDPPRLAISIELYTSKPFEREVAQSLRRLSRATTGPQSLGTLPDDTKQPVSVVSASLDAGDPLVREQIQRFAKNRGNPGSQNTDYDWHLYHMSMDRFSEFATYVMSYRLLDAEARRVIDTGRARGG